MRRGRRAEDLDASVWVVLPPAGRRRPPEGPLL